MIIRKKERERENSVRVSYRIANGVHQLGEGAKRFIAKKYSVQGKKERERERWLHAKRG